MSKVLGYHAVMLPGSQQHCCESLNYIHITKICVDYLKILSYYTSNFFLLFLLPIFSLTVTILNVKIREFALIRGL